VLHQWCTSKNSDFKKLSDSLDFKITRERIRCYLYVWAKTLNLNTHLHGETFPDLFFAGYPDLSLLCDWESIFVEIMLDVLKYEDFVVERHLTFRRGGEAVEVYYYGAFELVKKWGTGEHVGVRCTEPASALCRPEDGEGDFAREWFSILRCNLNLPSVMGILMTSLFRRYAFHLALCSQKYDVFRVARLLRIQKV
jgi:hypothetical protein